MVISEYEATEMSRFGLHSPKDLIDAICIYHNPQIVQNKILYNLYMRTIHFMEVMRYN